MSFMEISTEKPGLNIRPKPIFFTCNPFFWLDKSHYRLQGSSAQCLTLSWPSVTSVFFSSENIVNMCVILVLRVCVVEVPVGQLGNLSHNLQTTDLHLMPWSNSSFPSVTTVKSRCLPLTLRWYSSVVVFSSK